MQTPPGFLISQRLPSPAAAQRYQRPSSFTRQCDTQKQNCIKKAQTGITFNFFSASSKEDEPLLCVVPPADSIPTSPSYLQLLVPGAGSGSRVPLNPLLCLHKWKTAPIKKSPSVCQAVCRDYESLNGSHVSAKVAGSVLCLTFICNSKSASQRIATMS